MATKRPGISVSFGFGQMISVAITMIALFVLNGILLHLFLIKGYVLLPLLLQSGQPRLAFQTIVPAIMMAVLYVLYDRMAAGVRPSAEDK